MSKKVEIVGANPIVRLFDGEQVTAAVAVWIVDWSVKGRGVAVVLWHNDTVRVLGPDATLAHWLAEDFTRHFPEFADLPWTTPTVEKVPVDARVNLAAGLNVVAGDVIVETSKALDHRQFTTDSFEVGGRHYGLTMVIAPQGIAEVTIAGERIAGRPRISGESERPSSSAFVTAAEVWTR